MLPEIAIFYTSTSTLLAVMKGRTLAIGTFNA